MKTLAELPDSRDGRMGFELGGELLQPVQCPHGTDLVLVKEELCAVLTPELSSGYTGLVTNAAS
ncbi:hypothetical protein ACIQNG_25335 [Streptomyces sp. NPDC091377]|uniref:hypothetical protein n=1 Tax=Streptomyces sp. NPDC091377 TaxID=3365995 RepID=UPI0038262928